MSVNPRRTFLSRGIQTIGAMGFMEGDANLVTAYGLMALARVLAKA
jgi:hypothetical protein